MTAERFWSAGYFAASRSMRRSALSLSNLFSMPVTDANVVGNEARRERRVGGRASGIAAGDHTKFFRIRVMPHVAVDHRADCEIAPRVDELVRGAACRAADEVALAHAMLVGAEAKRSLAFEDKKEFL